MNSKIKNQGGDMKRNRGRNGLLRKIWRSSFLLAVLGLGMAIVSDIADITLQRAEQQTAASGWGGEAVFAIADQAVLMSPIAVANACGLGASSCFKCHSGKRAALPKMDAKAAPWHAQHTKANNSCVGCHKGNPRIMKEDLSHAKMIAKPFDNSTDSCAVCHAGDLNKVQSAYQSLAGVK